MDLPDLTSNKKSSPMWAIVSVIPLLIGTTIVVLYILSSNNKNKAYSLLYLIPGIGPIVAYVLTESRDKYVSTMAGWVFVGQILSYVILVVLLHLIH